MLIVNQIIGIEDPPHNSHFYITLKGSTWAPVGKECSACLRPFDDPEEIVLCCYDDASCEKLIRHNHNYLYFHLSHWNQKESKYIPPFEKFYRGQHSYLSRCGTARTLYVIFPQHKEFVRKFLYFGGGINVLWDFEGFIDKGHNTFRKVFLAAIALNDPLFPMYLIEFIIRNMKKLNPFYIKKRYSTELIVRSQECDKVLEKLLRVN